MRFNIGYILFLCLLLMEGAVLIFTELIGMQIIMPFCGVSEKALGIVLVISILSLALGYLASVFIQRKLQGKAIYWVCILFSISLILSSFYHEIGSVFDGNNTKFSVIVLVILFPVTFSCGLFSPIIIESFSERNKIHRLSAIAFFVSTLGGFLSAFISGLFLIPTVGIKTSFMIFALIFIVLAATYFLLLNRKKGLSNKK